MRPKKGVVVGDDVGVVVVGLVVGVLVGVVLCSTTATGSLDTRLPSLNTTSTLPRALPECIEIATFVAVPDDFRYTTNFKVPRVLRARRPCTHSGSTATMSLSKTSSESLITCLIA